MATTSGIDLSLSGLASGLDWKTLISQLAQAERMPEIQWETTQSKINRQNNAFGFIKSYLNNLQADVGKLKDSTFFDSRTASVSNDYATASVSGGVTLGTFNFNVSQLATAAQITGGSNIAKPLNDSNDVSSLTLGTAGFSTAITAGSFTVNGASVTIATTDTLQDVFDKIATATSNAVTGSYNSGTDKITLSSSGKIVLGSAADTSNFLQVAQLYNNDSNSVASASALGNLRLTAAMSSSDLAGALTDTGSNTGSFTVNGVSFSYDVTTDSIQNVLDRINSSTAGVIASYDNINKQFILANKVTGDIGISVQDNTGHFLQATGLSGGTFNRGQNLLYYLNNGTQQLVSQSNTISGDCSGVAGLSVSVSTAGAFSVTIGSDTSSIKSAIQSFITDYNNVQSYISSQSAATTDSSGNVTAGILTGDTDAAGIASSLRSLGFSQIAGLNGALKNLANLGISTNGKDNTISLGDESALDDELANNLNDVKNFFADSTNGWAVKFDSYLTRTVGDDGTLTQHQTSLTNRIASIDTQIANLEKTITADSNHWTAEFQAMEQAQSQINQQMNYLTRQISSGAL